MNDHSDFVDRLIDASETHPDESDPYWVEFWRLKSVTDSGVVNG